MNTIKRMITSGLMLCCFILATLLSGCSAGTPSADKIMSDLNSTDFINAAELYGNDEAKTIPVTSVSIVDSKKKNKNCRITCTVVQEDDHYKKESQLMISYNKLDNWFMDTYNATNVSVIPIAGVPDDLIRNSYEVTSLEGYNNKKAVVECSNIAHNFNSVSLTDNISVECTVTSETCKRTVLLSLNYKFNGEWKKEKCEKNTISREWLVDNLVGTTWTGSLGFGGVRTVRINSIDTANQTIDLDYGYSSLTQSEVCSYKIKDYTNYDEKKQALVIPLMYDFYDMEILDDGIWYGVNLNKIAETFSSSELSEHFESTTLPDAEESNSNETDAVEGHDVEGYVIAAKLDTNYVLDIAGAETADGANLQLWERNSQYAQLFELRKNDNGYYQIVNINSGKALAAEKGGTEENTNVCQENVGASNSQYWKLVDAGNGYYYIIERNSGLYLDVDNAWTENGVNVKLFPQNEAYEAQKWKLIKE